mgnify:FL=1
MNNNPEKAQSRVKDSVSGPDSGKELLLKAAVTVYNEVHNYSRFNDEQRNALEAGLDEVRNKVIPELDEDHANTEYIAQVGGASTYVRDLMLEQTAEKANSPEFMNDLLHQAPATFMGVSGWERFTDPEIWEQQKRLRQYSRES